MVTRSKTLLVICLALQLAGVLLPAVAAQQARPGANRRGTATNRRVPPGGTPASGETTTQTENREIKRARDAAFNFRRILPVLPSLTRGADGILNLNGQRATQNTVVTTTNVKDPATDTFVFTGELPVEAAESVQIPIDQFTVSMPKFYNTVPRFRLADRETWHVSSSLPSVAVKGDGRFRALSQSTTVTGPLSKGTLALFQSFDYRQTQTTLDNIAGDRNNTDYQTYDSNTLLTSRRWKGHDTSVRLALFSQNIDQALLTGMFLPESAPDFRTRGGQVGFSDIYVRQGGLFIDSSVSFRALRLRLSPRGTEPMVFEEQGEISGSYFDRVRRSSNRLEWRETVRFPDFKAFGDHQISVSGGFARAAFDNSQLGNEIILTGEEEDELTSITTFTGSPLTSFSANEFSVWAEDRWQPVQWLHLTGGLRYDWTTHSRQKEWGPRFGFALLPFRSGHTVLRGGAGVFYDILPLTAAVFPHSRQRVMQFFEEGEPDGEPHVLENLTTATNLQTPHVTAWNLELDQEVGNRWFLRVKAEDRRGKQLLLLNPDKPSNQVSALILSNTGTTRLRSLETTLTFRVNNRADLNSSYTRSSSWGDTNIFNTVYGTFERLTVGRNRYARARSDAPHRFLTWGRIQLPLDLRLMPALDVRTGFPFGVTDADNQFAANPDFGRYPRTVSFDLGIQKDTTVHWFNKQSRVRIGLSIYNLTNHFNPVDVETGEEGVPPQPVVRRFFNSRGTAYRANVTFSF